MFLEDGQWPPLAGWTATTEKRLDQRRLADTLDAIGRQGAKALYGGEIGAAIVEDVRAKGGSLALDDLTSYRAQWLEPLEVA